MTFLKMLAEAVNAVADWPAEWCMASDSPAERQLGYQVGDECWRVALTDVRREIPIIEAKRDQLIAMAKPIKLPLDPFPKHVREREILARMLLLKAATFITNTEQRQETAKWITFLGRLRACPNGRLLFGDPEQEPVPMPRPRAYLVRG